MFKNKLAKFALIAFSGLFLTSGIERDQADLNRVWGELNSNNSFNLSKQSFCFDINGTVFGQNIHQLVRPASVSKMYTSLWAMSELGYDYRFQTIFSYDQKNLYILGGNDSYFVTENLILILNELNNRGITNIENIYFDMYFKFNWSNDSQSIKSGLEKVFKTSRWTRSEKEAFKNVNDYLYEQSQSSILKPVFNFKRILFRNELNAPLSSESITHFSSPLYQQLKPINMYSNNFYHDNIFDFLGGNIAFHDFMYREFNANDDEIYFYTGSGLGENRTTCELTLRLLKRLREFLNLNGLEPMDQMAVAGVDEGTLAKRFTQSKYNQYISAKTGTLRHTSTLAGYINDANQTIFGVFNHTYNIAGARELQNEFIKYFMDDAQLIPLEYSPSNTSSIVNIQLK